MICIFNIGFQAGLFINFLLLLISPLSPRKGLHGWQRCPASCLLQLACSASVGKGVMLLLLVQTMQRGVLFCAKGNGPPLHFPHLYSSPEPHSHPLAHIFIFMLANMMDTTTGQRGRRHKSQRAPPELKIRQIEREAALGCRPVLGTSNCLYLRDPVPRPAPPAAFLNSPPGPSLFILEET